MRLPYKFWALTRANSNRREKSMSTLSPIYFLSVRTLDNYSNENSHQRHPVAPKLCLRVQSTCKIGLWFEGRIWVPTIVAARGALMETPMMSVGNTEAPNLYIMFTSPPVFYSHPDTESCLLWCQVSLALPAPSCLQILRTLGPGDIRGFLEPFSAFLLSMLLSFLYFDIRLIFVK